MMVELATLVHRKEPIHNKKCRASIVPDNRSNNHSERLSDRMNGRCCFAKGSIITNVIASLYIACMDTGLLDHFTNMEENDMAIMPINKGINTGIGALFEFMMVK